MWGEFSAVSVKKRLIENVRCFGRFSTLCSGSEDEEDVINAAKLDLACSEPELGAGEYS